MTLLHRALLSIGISQPPEISDEPLRVCLGCGELTRAKPLVCGTETYVFCGPSCRGTIKIIGEVAENKKTGPP